MKTRSFRRLTRSLLPILLASGAVAGCSAGAPPDAEVTAASREPLAAVCSDADLAWRDDVSPGSQRCAGPWLATPRTRNVRTRAGECGYEPDGAPTTSSCRRLEHGVESWTTRTYSYRGFMKKEYPPGCNPGPIDALVRSEAPAAAPPRNCHPTTTPVCLLDLFERAVSSAVAESAQLYAGASPAVDPNAVANLQKDIMARSHGSKVVSADGTAVTCNYDVAVATALVDAVDKTLCGETPGAKGAAKPCPDEVTYSDGAALATGAGTTKDAVCSSTSYACMDGYSAPSCSTCEQARSAPARFACLETSRQSALLDGATKSEIARREKLLFELHGHELAAADRATLEGLYASYPGAVSSCGAMATDVVPSGDVACAPMSGTLALCNALTQDHVPAALVGLYASRCLTLGADVAPSCVTGAAAADYEKIALRLLAKLSVDLPAPAAQGPSADRVAALVDRLTWATAWHKKATDLVARGALPTETFASDARAVAGVLTQLALSPSSASIPGAARGTDGTLAIDPSLARVLDDTFAQETIRALGAVSTTLPTALGAPLAATSLTRLASAIERTTDVYDVALSLIPLGAQETRPAGVAEVYGLLRALTVLTDDAALTRVASSGVARGALPAGWQETLAQGAKGSVASMFSRWASSGDAAALALQAVFARASQRAQHLDESGMFTPERTTRLRSSLLDESEGAVLAVVDARRTQLEAHIGTVVTERKNLLQTVLSELDRESTQKSVEVQIGDRLRRLAEIDADTIALRQAQAKAELSFNDVASQYRAVAGAAQDTDAYTTTTWGTGAAASFSLATVKAGRDKDDRDLSKIGTKLGEASPGDVIRLSPSGKWSPTCALSRVGAPDGKGIDVSGEPLTGPEGFTFTRSDSGYAARTVTKTHTESESSALFASVKACVTASSGIGESAVIHNDLTFSIEACAGAEWRKTKDNSTAQSDVLGGQAETQLAFNVGVRSPEVPVPTAPVGSLLAVQVPAGERDVRRATRIDVVREAGSSLVVSGGGAVDLYLLPNEVIAPECASPSTSALTVTAARAIPQGKAMEIAAKAMATAAEKLRVEASALEGQGRLLPSDAARLSALAETVLATALSPLKVTDLPPSAHSFFQTVTAQTLGVLERTIELRALERARAALQAELGGLEATTASVRGQLMTLRQLARWTVADTDDTLLGTDVSDLSRLVREYLLPLATVRHPEVLSALGGTSSAAAAARGARSMLLTRAWTDPTVDHVREVGAFIDGLRSLLAEANLDGSTVGSTSTVILQIPNPFASADTAADLPDFPRIDDKRRELVWNAIVAPPASAPATVNVDVLPRDLYVADFYGAALSCNEVRPVVTASALYAAIPDNAEAQIVDGLYKISSRFDKAQTFILAEGPKLLTLTPALGEPFGFEGRSASLKLLAGTPGLAHVRIQDEATRLPGDFAGGAGLSPFETVTLPVARLHSVLASSAGRLAKVQALSLVMRVSTRSTPTRLSWIESCQGQGF